MSGAEMSASHALYAELTRHNLLLLRHPDVPPSAQLQPAMLERRAARDV